MKEHRDYLDEQAIEAMWRTADDARGFEAMQSKNVFDLINMIQLQETELTAKDKQIAELTEALNRIADLDEGSFEDDYYEMMEIARKALGRD